MPALSELFDLSGRVAIVTGGSRGLGQEMAEGLAEAGGALMLCARREEWLTPAVAALRARGFTVEGAICDVSRSSEVQAVVDRTMATYGRLDILINNAGVSWGAEPEAMPIDKWQKVIDINLTGSFLFSQAAGRGNAQAASTAASSTWRPRREFKPPSWVPTMREKYAASKAPGSWD